MPGPVAAAPTFLTLEDAARVAGHCRWVETRLFEVLGSWVAVEPDPAVKGMWSTHSLRHAANAAGWHDRQPRVAHLDPDALAVAAGTGVASLVDALREMIEPGQTVARLAAVTRVVQPRLLAAYRARAERAHPLADGPTVRWIAVLLAAGEAAGAEDRALLDTRIGSAADVDAAGAAERSVAALLPEGPGIIGLTRHAGAWDTLKQGIEDCGP